MRTGIAALTWATAGIWLSACELGVFDYRLATPSELDASALDGGSASAAKSRDIEVRDSLETSPTKRPALDASVHQVVGGAAATDTGQAMLRADGGAAPVTGPADAGKSPAGQTAQSGQLDAGRDAGNNANDGGNTPLFQATEGTCPLMPSAQDDSFCCDFQDQVNVANFPTIYDLRSTPQIIAAYQLALVADPTDAQNLVLQTKPSLSDTEVSATLSHDTQPFDRATVAFDIWVNDALLNTNQDVSWFRYVSTDDDDEHATALVFRRGQALLRSGDGKDQTLTRTPRTDGQATHVTLDIDRTVCRADIRLDGVLAASLTDDTCAADGTGFVEFGLMMADRASGEQTAYYDNIAFIRR